MELHRTLTYTSSVRLSRHNTVTALMHVGHYNGIMLKNSANACSPLSYTKVKLFTFIGKIWSMTQYAHNILKSTFIPEEIMFMMCHYLSFRY